MYFKDEYHSDLYNEFIAKLDGDDVYYKGFAYVASAIGKKGVVDAISKHRVKFDKLCEMAKYWSNTERAMLEVAYQMFNGRNLYEDDEEIKFPTIDSMLRSLDSKNVTVVLEAIKMKYL